MLHSHLSVHVHILPNENTAYACAAKVQFMIQSTNFIAITQSEVMHSALVEMYGV